MHHKMYIIAQVPTPPPVLGLLGTQEAQQEVSSKAIHRLPGFKLLLEPLPYPKGWGQLLESIGSP